MNKNIKWSQDQVKDIESIVLYKIISRDTSQSRKEARVKTLESRPSGRHGITMRTLASLDNQNRWY